MRDGFDKRGFDYRKRHDVPPALIFFLIVAMAVATCIIGNVDGPQGSAPKLYKEAHRRAKGQVEDVHGEPQPCEVCHQ